MSLMWMPAQTTVPPLATAASAAGTSAPAGAKTIAASTLPASDLADDVRRGLQIRVPLRHHKPVPRIGQRLLGEAAVDRVAREAGAVAGVLAAAGAEPAPPAGPTEPGNAHPLPRAEAHDAAAELQHRPNDLVAKDQGELGSGESPSMMCRSVRQTPQACTFSRSWP
jgi:hypothetical protein